MLTIEDLSKKAELKQQMPIQNLQSLISTQNVKEVTEADLIDCEAGVIFLGEMVKWLETLVELRKTATGSHLGRVER
jgi:hypothetical protein